MCNYIIYKQNIPYCSINNLPCVCMRYCNKVNAYIINTNSIYKMDDCNVRKQYEKGNVLFEKHGYLYIKVNNDLNIKRLNPFDYIPDNVELGIDENGEYYIIQANNKE